MIPPRHGTASSSAFSRSEPQRVRCHARDKDRDLVEVDVGALVKGHRVIARGIELAHFPGTEPILD
ncbi:MAG: hypothetical protein ACRDVW_12090, partial [Acidimicrobiales bacterium]